MKIQIKTRPVTFMFLANLETPDQAESEKCQRIGQCLPGILDDIFEKGKAGIA